MDQGVCGECSGRRNPYVALFRRFFREETPSPPEKEKSQKGDAELSLGRPDLNRD